MAAIKCLMVFGLGPYTMRHNGLIIYGALADFCRKLGAFQISDANTQAWTSTSFWTNRLAWSSTLAYYGISNFQIHNVFNCNLNG